MAKAKKNKQVTKKAVTKKVVVEERITLEDLDAISSDEEEGDDVEGKDEWNAEALALRQAIADGAFNHLLKKSNTTSGDADEEFVEAGIDDEDADDEVAEGEQDNQTEKDSEEQNEEDESEDEEEQEQKISKDIAHGKALASVYEEMRSKKRSMPWAESFSVIPEKPLPFGGSSTDGSPLDVHDDLKRELAFYNMALEAANEARNACKQAGVSFSRPDDFFAEMVKSDDHMAKVKDRLIFETKKMDAVAQRKSNKEQKLLSKEKQSNKLAEKSKRKKDHFAAVDDWAKTAAQNRGPALREDDNANLGKMNTKRGWKDRDGNIQEGPNKKRMTADTKYGFGGKKGRFKQNDPKAKNDMSGFNPKGNFSGSGTKSKGGAGAKRQGKRARDAGSSRKSSR